MRTKVLVPLMLLAVLLAACSYPPSDFQRIDPNSPPDPKSYGTPQDGGNGSKWITCKVTMQTQFDGTKYVSSEYLVTFSGYPDYIREPQWVGTQEDFTERVLTVADASLQKGLGISSALWQTGAHGDHMFQLDPISGQINNPVDFYTVQCPKDWTVVYNLVLRDYHPAKWSDNVPENWIVTIARPNDGPDAYFIIRSELGHVEFPVRHNELVAIMTNKFDPNAALKNISFTDAASTFGSSDYATQIWKAATQVQDNGEIVARFNWTSIESQETVLNFAARAMLLKAWISGTEIHQPAFFGYMKDKNIAVTSLNVHSSPISGAFVLGFGGFSGGASDTTFQQTVTSESSMEGDLYLYNTK